MKQAHTQKKPESDFDKPIYTKEELVKKLKVIFKKHISRENPITRGRLYKGVFGKPELYDAYELWYNWNRIKQAMNWMRRTSKYFIVSRPNKRFNSVWEYFIVVDEIDAETYKKLLRNTRKKINYMLKRVDEAVQKSFWKDVRDDKR